VLAGGSTGLMLKGRVSDRFSKNITRAIGLCVCVIGVSSALDGNFMLLVVSLALGALLGELLNIDKRLNIFGNWMQNKFNRKDSDSDFSQGFVTSTLLFCVGAMSIVGSIESGLGNDRSIIYTKSILDSISAMVFASTFGVGVLFSAIVILLYQGSIELFASYLQNSAYITDELITQISAAGGVMVLAIGLNMAVKTNIKVANLLPGLAVSVGYYYLFLN